MAVQPLNAPPAPTPQTGVQGARPPQPTAQEVERPRETDQVDVSREAQERAKTEDTRRADQQQTQEAQQGAATQFLKDDAKQANLIQDRGRVDVLA